MCPPPPLANGALFSFSTDQASPPPSVPVLRNPPTRLILHFLPGSDRSFPWSFIRLDANRFDSPFSTPMQAELAFRRSGCHDTTRSPAFLPPLLAHPLTRLSRLCSVPPSVSPAETVLPNWWRSSALPPATPTLVLESNFLQIDGNCYLRALRTVFRSAGDRVAS